RGGPGVAGGPGGPCLPGGRWQGSPPRPAAPAARPPPGRAGAGGGAGLAPAAAWRARPTPPGVPPDPATAAPAGVPRGGRVLGNRDRGLAGPRSAERGGGRAAVAVRSLPRFETT